MTTALKVMELPQPMRKKDARSASAFFRRFAKVADGRFGASKFDCSDAGAHAAMLLRQPAGQAGGAVNIEGISELCVQWLSLASLLS